MIQSRSAVPALTERFGKYHVLARIAQGGMAEVYKVKTVGIAGFEKVQALKRILPELASEQRFIRSFVDEARIAVELNHRNIVQVFDFGKVGDELFLSMELIDGVDLRSALEQASNRQVRLPVHMACYILGEVGTGLDYAHRKTDSQGEALGIVHCDVSPQNIMLSFEGYVKILDFGVSRARIGTQPWTRRLRGKPRYMAPEQTRGEPPTPSTDVFALGIVCWEMLTGLPLFEGPDLQAVLEAVRRADAPAVDKLNPDVPALVASAVSRALSLRPEDRGTAADLATVMANAAQLISPQANARALAQWLEAVYPPEYSEKVTRKELVRAEGSGDTRTAGDKDDNAAAERITTRHIPRFVGEQKPKRVTSQPHIIRRRTAAGTGATRPMAAQTPGQAPGQAPSQQKPAQKPRSRGADFDTGPTATLDRPHAAALLDESAPTKPVPKITPAPMVTNPSAVPPPPGPPPARPRPRAFGPAVTTTGLFGTAASTTVVEEDLVESVDESPLRLLEKRRVVAAAMLIEGGTESSRRELTCLLGDLAYKRGAVVHCQDEDSLVVVFGLEVAGEDDVARAMSYALDAVEAAREAGASTGGHLAMRFAARAGIVAAPDDKGGYRLVGDAVEETRELARGAEPGRPLLSGGAGRLTSAYYAFRELPVRRHRRRRLRVLELIGPRSFDERDRSLHNRAGRFFGRFREIAQLSQALDHAVTGKKRAILALVGPPGVGKSRILAEFVARAKAAAPRGEGPYVVAVSATPGSKSAPFAMTIELLQAALNLPPGRGETARSRLAQRMRHVLAQGHVAAADIDEVVGALEMSMELRDGVLVSPLHKSADLRERVIGALHSLRTVLMPRSRPLITILEDLHFADRTSLEVFRESLATGRQWPELIICTGSEDNDLVEGLSEWVEEVIHVNELSGDDLSEFIEDRLADSSTVERVSAIARRAGGNPLLIEQLAMEARDVGEIPPTARAVVTARVDRLPAATKAVLQHAAVAGTRFRARILEELLGREIAAELGELCDEALLRRDDGAPSESHEGELSFTAVLIREVVYDSLSSSARRETHAKLGQLLATRHRAGRDEPPATIAEHLELGGQLSAASAYWLRAGMVALAAGDAAAAVERFGRTLAIEDGRPDRDRSAASLARQREALAGREQAHHQIGEHKAQAGDLERLEAMVGGEPQLMADVKNRTAVLRLRMGEFRAAVAASEQAEAAARKSGDTRSLGEALRIRGEVFERTGEFEKALDMTSKARDMFRSIGAVAEETSAMIGIARTQVVRGHYEAALSAYRPIIERVRQSGDPWLERMVQNHMAVVHLCLGEYEEAMTSVQRALAICQRYGDRAREGDCLSVCGIILMEVGQYDEARAYFGRALDILETTGSRWSRADCLVYAGATEACLGQYEDSLARLREAIRLARDIGARYVWANALVALASALLARDGRGDVGLARKAAAKAVEVAREATLVGPELQGLSRLAETWRRAGKLDKAVELSNQAMQLLGKQRYIEGSEQEIYFVHYRVMSEAGDKATARSALDLARAEVERKQKALVSQEWRRSFAEDVATNAAILQAAQRHTS